jgi:hypothetical protein
MKVTLAAMCDYASVSQDGKLNILGIFQEINAPTIPFQLAQMFLVVSFSASSSEAPAQKKFEVKLLGADGAQVFAAQQTVPIQTPPRTGARVNVNALMGFGGLVFPAPGDYAFSILIDGDEKESVPLRVNPPGLPPPPAQQLPPPQQ